MYNCNWILALTSVCLVALSGWTAARPDACEGMRLVFHNGSFGCHGVTDTGLVRFGTLDDCANECDRQHYKALGGATGRRSLGPLQAMSKIQSAFFISSTFNTCLQTCKLEWNSCLKFCLSQKVNMTKEWG